ncbi:MAG: Sec-C motif domain protein [Bacteroidetes bacterium HGW-Bacteroidetes-11]|jgi:SEC-C motif-containing protein|nr:MAG: Sec-C motif domain protein [Bacteroidetes bacterium HGW-Bacteroidetes-11]
MSNSCPCGSSIPVSLCCEAIISGKRKANTAEELMRSRYVAFSQANAEYLMQSQHSETRRLSEMRDIQKWAKSVIWMGLAILSTRAGTTNDETGYVEFRAFYMESGQMQQIHEKSLFKRENGKWVYFSGVNY